MKRIIFIAYAFLMSGVLTGSAQDAAPPAGASAAAAPAAAPAAVKKASLKKAPKKAPIKKKTVKAASPAPAAVAVEEVPQVPQAVAAPAESSAPAATEAAGESVKPETARPSSCHNCFQQLPAGYNEILTELRSWMDEMEVQASALDRRLSDIQKQINEKEDAIEQAKLGTDKKEVKAAVKALTKERKALIKQYSMVNDEKDDFYGKFSAEAVKKVEGYNKIVEEKLKMTLSAADR